LCLRTTALAGVAVRGALAGLVIGAEHVGLQTFGAPEVCYLTEVYLAGPTCTRRPEDYLTEVIVPVRRRCRLPLSGEGDDKPATARRTSFQASAQPHVLIIGGPPSLFGDLTGVLAGGVELLGERIEDQRPRHVTHSVTSAATT
jgi:hypothetical protein